MQIKSIIFDLDGTLLDSLVGIADAMNKLLEQLNYPTHPLDPYRYFVGDGIRELVCRAIPQEKRERHDIDELVTRYRAFYDETWPRASPPYDGVPELLDELWKRNIPCSILSNKSDDFTKRMVRQLLPRWDFVEVRGHVEGVPRKPDPASALQVAKINGAAPQETMFVGDTAVDMNTGVNSGMFPVGVTWGFRDEAELRSNGAKKIIHHPRRLLELL